jgi:hypothetical protein
MVFRTHESGISQSFGNCTIEKGGDEGKHKGIPEEVREGVQW